MWDWGFFGFIFYVCLCLGLNLFIPQVIAHPIRSSTCRELVVLSCLMGICLGHRRGFQFLFLLFKCSREAVAALWGMKNYRTACGWFGFFNFLGVYVTVLSGSNCMPLFLQGFPTLFNPIMLPTSAEAGRRCFVFSPSAFEM